MQLRIPPELRQITKVVTPITGIDRAPDMEHHDPSNIIRYRDRYYLWFTEMRAKYGYPRECHVSVLLPRFKDWKRSNPDPIL